MSEEKIRLGLGNIENKWQNENPKLVKAVLRMAFCHTESVLYAALASLYAALASSSREKNRNILQR